LSSRDRDMFSVLFQQKTVSRGKCLLKHFLRLTFRERPLITKLV
jgi:hypothetical protein